MKRLMAFCFFLISVTYTIGWTAISSELAYFKSLYGPQVLLQLNLAFFLPSIPVLLLQNALDEHFDGKFGTGRATCFRFSFGFGGMLGVTIAYPFLPERVLPVLVSVALLGIASGVLFGSSYQLVSRFPANNTVALTLGYVASGPLVLLLNWLLDIGPCPSAQQRYALFASVTVITLLGLVAAVIIFERSWSWLEGGASPQDQEQEARPLVGAGEDGSDGGAEEAGAGGVPAAADRRAAAAPQGGQAGLLSAAFGASPGKQAWLPWAPANGQAPWALAPQRQGGSPCESRRGKRIGSAALLAHVWPAALSLGGSIATSVLLFPFFTYVPSCGRMTDMLPQRLFAARVAADIAGRVLPKSALVRSPAGLLALAGIKVGLVPLFFMYIDGSLPYRNDWLAIGYVALQWWLSGYANTCAYVAAPGMAPRGFGPRAGALMALVFQLSSLAALLVALAVQSLHYSSRPGLGVGH